MRQVRDAFENAGQSIHSGENRVVSIINRLRPFEFIAQTYSVIEEHTKAPIVVWIGQLNTHEDVPPR